MDIFIIRPGAIGDALLTFPVLKAVRTSYPGSHITFVGNHDVLPLALEWGLVDEVSDYQSPRWSELFSTKGIKNTELLNMLRKTDLAICLLRDPDQIVERNVRAAGAKQCIIAPGRPPDGAHIHIVNYLANVMFGHSRNIEWRGMGDKWGASGHVGIPLAGIRDRVARADQPAIAIHPGSGGRQKCWPVERFAAVIEELWRRSWPVLVLTGPADGEQRDYLQRHLTPPSSAMLEMLDGAPLIEVAKRLQNCRYYLGNDSGVTHLAALLGLPTIALFGPSDPSTWHPVGKHVTVIYEPFLANIAVSTVISAIEQHLHD
jgi:heptosyltransferase-3